MVFDVFQTATATMKRKTKDRAGDETVAESFQVKIDPVLGNKRIYTDQNEVITGIGTVISAHDSIDITSTNYVLDYNGREYQIENMVPQYHIGTNNISHYEVTLR
jgi:hypothetical protein